MVFPSYETIPVDDCPVKIIQPENLLTQLISKCAMGFTTYMRSDLLVLARWLLVRMPRTGHARQCGTEMPGIGGASPPESTAVVTASETHRHDHPGNTEATK